MDATTTSNVLPIEVRYTVSEETADEFESAMKDVLMPPWLQVLLPFALGFQLLFRLPELLSDPKSNLPFVVLGFIGVFYGIIFWLRHRSRRQARAALRGKEVAVRFEKESFNYSTAQDARSLNYSSIVRVGRDDRGLMLVIEKIGGLWIPTRAFASPAQRDYVFGHLGHFLKKR
jgi:hypothetical protein